MKSYQAITALAAPIVLLAAFVLPPAPTSAMQQVADDPLSANMTTLTKKLFTYAGPLLPRDWSLVSILNERVLIGFNNGTARNSPLTELEPKDRAFVERLQNGTVYSTPLSSAKEKFSQWSSSVSSTVSKFGKSFRDQFDSLINNSNKTNSTDTTNTNSATIISN